MAEVAVTGRAPGAAGPSLGAVGRAVLPVLAVVACIVAIWYVAGGHEPGLDAGGAAAVELTRGEIVADTMNQDGPCCRRRTRCSPSSGRRPWASRSCASGVGSWPNPRSLLFHAWQTLAPTLLGFVIGGLAGILLAVGIVHNRAMDLSVMPWAIASQTIPILAIAPMIIVVLNSIGLGGADPEIADLGLSQFLPGRGGHGEGAAQPRARWTSTFCAPIRPAGRRRSGSCRLPASVPFLFASLKVGIAAALVGTIVAELPTGARFGLGARLLTGSYYGQTIQIWSALFMAAICAAALVATLGLIERMTLRRMGLDR
jgi:NitT/TauT family transport system permease protein